MGAPAIAAMRPGVPSLTFRVEELRNLCTANRIEYRLRLPQSGLRRLSDACSLRQAC